MPLLFKKSLILTGALLAIVAFSIQANADIIKPTINLDHPVILADSQSAVCLLVQFDIPKQVVDTTEPRPDLNLGMVIDRSGSMSDRGKMSYAIRAANKMVDQLQPTDHLSVVEYDDRISVLWPSTPVESPSMIKAKIEGLFPRGSTNLTGGMMRGVEEVMSAIDREKINRVILLSDGLANTGVTDPREIKRLVRESKQNGVTITTMGLGLDYNEDLMQMIAENAGGNYYFIENPDQMNAIFQNELGMLFATIAKDVRLYFKPNDVVKKVDVFGYLAKIEENQADIEMEDLFTGEKRSMVIRLEIMPEGEGKFDVGEFGLSYLDVDENEKKSYTSAIKVESTTDPEKVKEATNEDVVIEATLFEAEEYHNRQVRLYEEGDIKSAQSNIAGYVDELRVKNSTLGSVVIDKKIEALEMESDRMDWAEQSVSNKSYYLKQNKAQYYRAQKGKRGMYIMQEGDSDYMVQRLKKALADKGFYNGEINEDFTPDLTDAIKEFQKSENLTVDGIAGPATLSALGLY